MHELAGHALFVTRRASKTARGSIAQVGRSAKDRSAINDSYESKQIRTRQTYQGSAGFSSADSLGDLRTRMLFVKVPKL